MEAITTAECSILLAWDYKFVTYNITSMGEHMWQYLTRKTNLFERGIFAGNSPTSIRSTSRIKDEMLILQRSLNIHFAKAVEIHFNSFFSHLLHINVINAVIIPCCVEALERFVDDLLQLSWDFFTINWFLNYSRHISPFSLFHFFAL